MTAQPMALEDLNWREDALDIVERWATQGRRFTADDLRTEMKRPAPHKNMVGAIFTTAQRRGWITKNANTTSRMKSRNGGHQYEWIGKTWRDHLG